MSAGASERRTLEHLPGLDGLRGLAVLGVLLFHDSRLTGGYLGVDLFFVLSGFLITRLLFTERESTGRIDLASFWIRRARRLFPALVALLPVVAVYAKVMAEKTELARIRGDGFATLAYFANWRAIFAGRSYWEMFLAPSPLEHTWSLAIEEQFYVAWPLIVVALFRWARDRARALLALSLALSAVSVILMAVLFDPERIERAYLGTDTRGGAILLGAALACVWTLRGPLTSERGVRVLDLAGAASALCLGVAWTWLDGASPFLYRGGFLVTEICVLVLIACAAHGASSAVSRALSFRPLTWVGLISYGVYLWHWPVFVALDAGRVGFGGAALSCLRFAVTFGISYVSYRFLEQPIRRGGLPFGRPAVVAPLAFAAAALAIVVGTRGAVSAEPPALVAPPPAIASADPGSPAPRDRRTFPADTPPVGSPPAPRMRVLVIGDSVAQALGERLFFVEDRGAAFVAERGVGDCSIMEGKLPTRSLTNVPHGGGNCAARWSFDVKELHPDVTLVILGGGFFAPIEIGGKWLRVCDAPAREAYVAHLVDLLKALGPDAGRIVVTRVPLPVAKWQSERWDRQTACFNDAMGDVIRAVPGAESLDLYARLCPEGRCAIESEGALIRPDGMHFGGKGAEATAEWVLRELRGGATQGQPK